MKIMSNFVFFQPKNTHKTLKSLVGCWWDSAGRGGFYTHDLSVSKTLALALSLSSCPKINGSMSGKLPSKNI